MITLVNIEIILIHVEPCGTTEHRNCRNRVPIQSPKPKPVLFVFDYFFTFFFTVFRPFQSEGQFFSPTKVPLVETNMAIQ